MELVVGKKPVNPASVADDLFLRIKDIEKATESASSNVAEIEGRGFFKSMVASTSSDLVAISKSQNKINDLLLGMINDVITLNVMSYAFLAHVMDEFSRRVSEGMHDSSGRIIKLSSVGKNFADSAASIFNKIIDGSRATQEKIELNAAQVEEIRFALVQKDRLDQRQSAEIQSLQQSIEETAQLDDRQTLEIVVLQRESKDLSNAIASVAVKVREATSVAARQADMIAALKLSLAEYESRHGALEDGHGSLRGSFEVTASALEKFMARVDVLEETVVSLRRLVWIGFGVLLLGVVGMAGHAFGAY